MEIKNEIYFLLSCERVKLIDWFQKNQLEKLAIGPGRIKIVYWVFEK